MIFKIENLGSLQHAEIDLSKDFTVFCGGNNTGKTYMTTAVFGLHKLQDVILFEFPNHLYILLKKYVDLIYQNGFIELDLLNNNELNEILNFAKQIEEKDYLFMLPDFFAQNSNFSDNIIATLPSIKSENLIPINLGYRNGFLTLDFIKNVNQTKINISMNETAKDIHDANFIKTMLANSIGNYLCLNYLLFVQKNISSKNVYMFPSERSSINLFGKELLLSRNQAFANPKTDTHHLRRYPLPIEEALRIANDLEFLSRIKSEYEYLAKELETLIGGKISVGNYGEMLFTTEQRKKVVMHGASSTVKSLSSLVFYFRHLAQKNDFIIIDEPELNLHPDNQRKVARFLARVFNEGFKLLISTHSDYIIRELNNLILLHPQKNTRKGTELIKKYGYHKNQTLDYTKIGAYMFMPTHNYPLPVDNMGFAVDSIDKEINDLGAATNEIYYHFNNLK